MRATGARNYVMHMPGMLLNSYNIHLHDAYRNVVGHVAAGAMGHWLALHAVTPSGNVRLRYGRFLNPDGSREPWFAANFNEQGWTPPMTRPQAVAYLQSLSPAQQNLIVTAEQAAADGAGQAPGPFLNPDGTCTGSWIETLTMGAAGSCLGIEVPPLAFACGFSLGFLALCGIFDVLPPPAPPPSGWNTPYDGGDPVPDSTLGDNGGASDPGGGVECP